MLIIIVLSAFFSLTQVFADIPIRERSELISLGFRKVNSNSSILLVSTSTKTDISIYKKNSLSWPIDFERPEQQFLGVLHQLQTYTTPFYYHGGVDILATEDQNAYAPITGIIEGGYYSYTDDYYGGTEKYFLSLKQALIDETKIPWGKKYFEIAIIDKQGNRFELHHIDPDTLPETIKNKVLKGNQNVEKGSHVGHVVKWDSKIGNINTRHLHYNIINHQEKNLNPFYFSKYYEDNKHPVITHIYAAIKSFCHKAPELIEFKDRPLKTNKFIVVRAMDLINESSWAVAPVLIEAKFENGKTFKWDFTTSIADEFGNRPPIRDVFLHNKCNKSQRTEFRATRNHDIYFKIPVEPFFTGDVEITVYDQNFNTDKRTISLIGESI